MKAKCAPACQSCDYLSTESRCPIDPSAPKAWEDGDLNRMFEKLTSEPYLSKHSVEILSSPATNGPWVITMEDFVSDAEAERLIELGSNLGYERSKGMKKFDADGTPEHIVSDARTSSHTWCHHNCFEDTIVRRVVERLSNVTGINENNSEYLQLLQYQPGQYYTVHHDYLKNELKRQQGNRILTVYMYLNDVEEGGGTNFNRLNMTVMPKKGRALLWPSVKNDAPRRKDYRTTHQALPVEKACFRRAWRLVALHDPNSKASNFFEHEATSLQVQQNRGCRRGTACDQLNVKNDDGTCGTTAPKPALCEDTHESCPYWAAAGECEKNPNYMHNNCMLSCGKCPGKRISSCRDDHEDCEKWADGLECEINPNYMLKNCRLSCGVCHDENLVVDLGVEQKTESMAFPDIDPADVLKQIEKSEEYMRTTHMRNSLRASCKNKHELCSIWAVSGRCETAPDSEFLASHRPIF
eukprot:scaffold2253_cov119-Cylindrotheca_fusiformis.AAC.18